MLEDRIVIVQPAVPQYRKRFFELLAEKKKIEVLCGEKSLEGAPTVIPEGVAISTKYGMVSLFGGRLGWQKRIISIPVHNGDIFILPGNIRILSTYILLLRSKLFGAKIIWWGQAWSAKTNKISFKIRIAISKIFADAFLVYTDNEIPMLVKENIPTNRIFAMNNAVDLEQIVSARNSWNSILYQQLNDKYSLQNRRIVLCVGRFTKKLNISFATKVITHHRRIDPDILYIFIGDGETASEFDRDVLDQGIQSSVMRFPSINDEHLLAGWFGVAKVFFYPGSVGLSLIHAMSYSLPCVLHNQFDSHMPEIAAFQEGVTGVSFPANDHSKCVQVINELIYNPEKSKSMGHAGFRIVSEKFTTSKMLQAIIGAIDCLRLQK